MWKNPNESVKKPARISEFSQMIWYKFDIQTLLNFLY